jgi:hypothetical protein
VPPKSGAERVQESRERARKAAAYDKAEEAQARAEEACTEALRLLAETQGELMAFRERQTAWVAEAQESIRVRDDQIAALTRELGETRQRINPLAVSPERQNAPQEENFVRLRCPRCQGPVDVPRGGNRVTTRST